MAKIHEVIKRDIGVKVEGVVKVFDDSALATEIREYVVTDKIEHELKRVLDTFTQVSETLRRGSTGRDVMGIWVSGFFGSGKSHFAKMLGHLLCNTALDIDGSESSIDSFGKHLTDSSVGRDVRLRLGEVKLNTKVHGIFFEIKSRQSLTNPGSVGEILLSEFYRSIGLSENIVVARMERQLQRRGLYEDFISEYETRFKDSWRSSDGREDMLSLRRRIAPVLAKIAPEEYPSEAAAAQAVKDIFEFHQLTAEGIADELVAWTDAQKTVGGKVAHLVFVIDEMGTFIGDSTDRISELNSLAEMIGNKGKGKVWLVVTSQQDLEKVVDRTNFQPALVGRLNARFELKPHLISDEINKVVSERLLKKHPSQEAILKDLYGTFEGHIAQLADLKASRRLGVLNERTFIDAYPFLPHQIQLAQDIFETLSGFRLSGGVRSMIGVVMDALQNTADLEVGALVSFDQIFDAVENDLLSQEYLGASGVRAIREADERLPNLAISPTRVLKVLWLIQRAAWVPRVLETLAKLLVRDFVTLVAELRSQVEEALFALQEAGYVARDEATGEWKFLNERERTIEQAIQEYIRPGGPKSISLASLRRTSQQICKDDLVTRKRLGNFVVAHGATKATFGYGVFLDGEAIDTGPELDVYFVSPLAPSRASESEDIRQQNQSAGSKGRKVWWLSAIPATLEARLRRYEALVKVGAEKRFLDDSSRETQDALSEKRKERDDLRAALVRDMEAAFIQGTLFYGGQEIELEGVGELREPLSKALSTLIPNAFPRFPAADRPFDFAKQLKALLSPATKDLRAVAPDLDLFDTQGSLQRESALVGTVLEVVKDLEDEGIEATGAILADAKDRKGFRGFSRTPFGWPDELVRLVLAACFRAGALYLERQSEVGAVPVYDYRDTEDHFAKVNTFKKTVFRVAATVLSVDEIKAANKALIALGLTGIPESGNAIAAAVRDLGTKLKAGIEAAELRAQQGLPIPDAVLHAAGILTPAITAKDPTVTVTTFLSAVESWKALHEGLKSMQAFLDANRHKDFETSRKLETVASTHPVPDSHSTSEPLRTARKDMDAIIGEKTVIARWNDYRDAFEQAWKAYRDCYLETYERVRSAADETLTAIRSGTAYGEAPADERDAVVAKVFGPGRACDYPPVQLSAVSSLLDAAEKHSLTALDQALVALPGYRAKVEATLRELVLPPPEPTEKVYEWHPGGLLGRRFQSESDVDTVLAKVAAEIKSRIRDGYTVVVT